MPGLLRGLGRVAAVAGTATAVSNRVSRRQGRRWAAQEEPAQQQEPGPPPPAAAPAPPQKDPLEQLKELGSLRDQGVLTPEEFAAQKAKVLAA
jgi:hypothetical protein